MAETTATPPTGGASGPSPSPGQTLATAVAEALHRHREAILAGDVRAIARWTDELSWLLTGLQAGAGQAARNAASRELVSAVRELRDSVRMNLLLAGNGIVIAHQFVAAVAEVSSVDSAALFAGVA